MSNEPGGAVESTKLAVVILAAGKGTRLNSRHPKVLHSIGGKPLLSHVVAAARLWLHPISTSLSAIRRSA